MTDQSTLLNSYSQALTTLVGWSVNTSDESSPTSGIVRQNFTATTTPIRGGGAPLTQISDPIDSIDIVFVVIGIVGIVDNSLAVVVMLLHKPLRQRLANYFLVNKCGQDLLTSVFLVLMITVKQRSQLKGLALEIYCRLWYSKVFFLGLFTSSLFSLAAVTFEKYLEVARPIQHRVKMTRKRVVWSIAILTVLAIGFKMSYIMSAMKVVNGSCKGFLYPNFAAQVVAGTANLFIEFLIPLMVIAYSYVGMAKSLRKSVQPSSIAKDIHPKMIRARRNIIKTLITVVLAFVICVSFKECVLTLQSYNLFKVDYNSWWFGASQAMAFLACCLDPIIYLIQYDAFRRGAKILLSRALSSYRKTTTPSVDRDDTESGVKTVQVF